MRNRGLFDRFEKTILMAASALFMAALLVVLQHQPDALNSGTVHAAETAPTPTGVLASVRATKAYGTCGATIVAGNPVYIDPTDGYKLKPAAQSSSTTAAVVGIAVSGCADEQSTTYVTEDPEFTPGSTLVEGEMYCLGTTTAGAYGECRLMFATATITPVAGSGGVYQVPMFIASSTTKAKLKILTAPSAY